MKSSLNGENETKNSIYSFTSLDVPSGCYKVTRKIFFQEIFFVLTLNECFVTPERLHFSVASSQNKNTFF